MNPKVSAAAATALYRYRPARPRENASANVPPLYDERECEGTLTVRGLRTLQGHVDVMWRAKHVERGPMSISPLGRKDAPLR